MTSEIYLCLPGQNISETHFTVNHGSGRKVPREIADKRHHDPKFKQATGNIVLNLEKTKLAREEAPYNYRDVGATMKDLETTGLAAKVARLQPFGVMIMGKK
jgi:RNA-splicing ligase RtcB